MRDGPDAAAAPPRCLLVRRDADLGADDRPATYAAYPSPVWTRWWSWRAGMKMSGLPFAASSTCTTFVVISVRRASVPSIGVSRCANTV